MKGSKKHLKVGDVARQLGVKKFLIREWEKEFGVLSGRCRPRTDMTAQDKLEVFARIKELICKYGKSIADVKKEVLQTSTSSVTPATQTTTDLELTHHVQEPVEAAHVEQETAQSTEESVETASTQQSMDQDLVASVEPTRQAEQSSECLAKDESEQAAPFRAGPILEHDQESNEQENDDDVVERHYQEDDAEDVETGYCVVNAAIVDRTSDVEQAESESLNRARDTALNFDNHTRSQLRDLKQHLIKLKQLLQ
ncbi:MAG: MerR family transcriptional regulator [Epsilonproteobacteria bacterium]|nr:MerR family transcriptional regulator [Campylobacterota bacterium]